MMQNKIVKSLFLSLLFILLTACNSNVNDERSKKSTATQTDQELSSQLPSSVLAKKFIDSKTQKTDASDVASITSEPITLLYAYYTANSNTSEGLLRWYISATGGYLAGYIFSLGDIETINGVEKVSWREVSSNAASVDLANEKVVVGDIANNTSHTFKDWGLGVTKNYESIQEDIELIRNTTVNVRWWFFQAPNDAWYIIDKLNHIYKFKTKDGEYDWQEVNTTTFQLEFYMENGKKKVKLFEPQRPFIITVKTDNEGVTDDNQFKIGTNAESGTYNYTVDCDGDGVNEATGVSGDYICTYDTAGTYTVKIGGEFPQIYFDLREGTYDNAKLLSIEQWGDIEWKSMEQAFIGCLNLVGNATDKPNLSNVTNMAEMFGASKFNQDIGDWDVSNIINMAQMFGTTPFNQDISQWDTSNVEDMRYMFSYATSFNQDLSQWNISKVTNMTDMFKDSNLSTDNYDAILNTWSQLDLQRDVPFGAGTIRYSALSGADVSRQSMIDDYNWTISDGEVIPPGTAD